MIRGGGTDIQQTSKVHSFPSYATEGTKWEVCDPLRPDFRQQNVEEGDELEKDHKISCLKKHWASATIARLRNMQER